MTYVTTKKELQDAIKRKDAEIMVSGDIAKKLKGIVKLKALPEKQQAALIALITGGSAVGIGTAIAAIAAVPVTGGTSLAALPAAFLIGGAGAGVSSGVIAIVLAIIAVVGVATIVALLKDYDVEMVGNVKETTFCFKLKK